MNDIIFRVLAQRLIKLGIQPKELTTLQRSQYLRDAEIAVLLHYKLYGGVDRLLK